jgi:Uma2 family endonuclease
MASVISASPPVFEHPPFPVYRFSVEDYHRLCELDLLDEDAPVELLEGWIVPQMPHSPLHDSTVHGIQKLLNGRLPADWDVRVQSAIVTGDSEPEPDVAVVRGPAARYRDHHPSSGEIGLIVEVADSSVAKDRRKAGVFAAIEVPVYWIVNLPDQVVEMYSQPDPLRRSYLATARFACGELIEVVLDSRVVAAVKVDDIFG